MALNFSTTDLAAARGQEREIEALPDREYIQTVCNVIVQALKNPATDNLDLSEIRGLVKEFSDKLEDKIYDQADRLGTETTDTTDTTDTADVDLDTGYNVDTFDEDFNESTKTRVDEAIFLLKKAGYTVNG